MKKVALCIVFIFSFVYIYSQELDYYYVEFKEGFEPQQLQTTVNTDQTLTLLMQNNNLAAALNAKPIYTFERAFPSATSGLLTRVYIAGISKTC